MRALTAALLLALPMSGEWLSMEIRFEGSGCVPCTQSLGERFRRIRGVESAEVDLERSIVKIKLAAGNRVRLEIVRDQLEQDGTKMKSARVEGVGNVVREQDGLVFRVSVSNAAYKVEAGDWKGEERAVRIEAETSAVRPTPALRLSSYRAIE
jgi:hypothetical protein